jgi:hypothetical protein
LTVTDAGGCRDDATQAVAVGAGTDPVGWVDFAGAPTTPADGVSTLVLSSDTIMQCAGGHSTSYRRFTVEATRGRILSADVDPAAGIQVRNLDITYNLVVTIQADRRGGPGRLLVQRTTATGESVGVAGYEFTGSTNLPQAMDFGPRGNTSLSPPRVVVRFDKPMDPASLAAAFTVSGSASGPVPGAVGYDPSTWRAIFSPDTPFPASESFTATVSAAARDAWQNPLDGDFDGVADGAQDALSWSFGALSDTQAPSISCRGESRDPFSPDGDGSSDTTNLLADLEDDTALRLWTVEILSPEGLVVRTLIGRLPAGQTQVDNATVTWDGHDQDGLLVDNGTYAYRAGAVDAAGNTSQDCTGSVQVGSVLNPADFPDP